MYYAKYSMRRCKAEQRSLRIGSPGYTLRPGPSASEAPRGARLQPWAEISDPRVNALVRRLEQRYADAVDSRRMDAWLDCFTEDGSYYVLGADNDADGLPLCLMMDDCRERLEDRATFVDEVWPGLVRGLSDPALHPAAAAGGRRQWPGNAPLVCELHGVRDRRAGAAPASSSRDSTGTGSG